MSKFFADHSDSESSSSSSSDSEQETKNKFASGSSKPFAQPSSYLFSDDEDDTKRVVRSAKEKRYEQLNTIIKNIRNSRKIKDFNKMETSFQELTKAYEKSKAVIAKEEKGQVPRFYLRILVEMEDLIKETWEDKEGRKSMNKNNSRSLGALRQKLRKYIRDEFEEDVAKFKENPDAPDDDEDENQEQDEEDEESGSEDEKVAPSTDLSAFKKTTKASKESKVAKKAESDDDDDSDDSYWDSDSDESSSSSSDDEPGMSLREKFLKKADDFGSTKANKEKKGKKERKRLRALEEDEEDDDDEDDDKWITVDRGAEKPKMFDKDAEVTHDLVIKKLHEIMAARGKKRTDRKEQIALLSELLTISEEHKLGMGISVKINFAIVSAIFDYNPKMNLGMKAEHWEKCIPAIEKLLSLLEEEAATLMTSNNFTDDEEQFTKQPYKVRGCIITVVERMDEEFIRVLKGCDSHSHEYVDRLKDEERLLSLFDRCQSLLESRGGDESSPFPPCSPADLCRIYMLRVTHLYFKVDARVHRKRKDELAPDSTTSIDEMDQLCKFIYSHDSTDRLRTRTILCHIYHHALHDNWYEARDLMLMSHLQDNITHADPPTQILYNRAMVQLGLCSFRQGEIRCAHNALLDIQLGGRSKELLAQGLLPQRHHEQRTMEQEKVEKQRQMPFHMHVNLEVLECVYLVSAMLIEIPYMAAHEFDSRKRMISKSFYQQLRSSERQALIGPPESMREHVVAAARAMRSGDWKACNKFIVNEKMNAKVWDLFYDADRVRTMIGSKIQEESLRTYLFTYSKVYNSISMKSLSEMFSLDVRTVHALISKMIINEDIMANLDEPSQCVIMHRTEPSRLQSLSLQLSDKIAQLVENNERLFDFRSGGWQRDGANWRRDNNSSNFRRGDNNNRRDGGGFRRDNYNRRDGGGFRRDNNYQDRSRFGNNTRQARSYPVNA